MVEIRNLEDAKHQKRFPRPWRYEERASAFVVLDANGQTLAHVYFRDANTAGRLALKR
jgi:hypothetical protein